MVADGQVVALLADQDLADRLSADCGLDRILHVADVDSEPVGGGAVHDQIHVRLAAHLKRAQIGDAGNPAHDGLNLVGLLLQNLQVGARKASRPIRP